MPREMTLSCAICQPHYLPWMGYFEMIDRVQLFVFLDDVQFIKREWKNRNRIRKEARSSETKWLSVPVAKQRWPGKPLCQSEIASHRPWASEHANHIRSVYRGAPHFADLQPILHLIEEGGTLLADFNISLVEALCETLGIDTLFERASRLGVRGAKTDRLLGICREVGAKSYLANDASRVYLDEAAFTRHGIDLEYQSYRHPSYAQRSGTAELATISHLSVIDLIANHGGGSLEIIRRGRGLAESLALAKEPDPRSISDPLAEGLKE